MVWRVGWLGQLGGTLTAVACVWVAVIVVQQEWQYRSWLSALWFPAVLTAVAVLGASMFTWLPRVRLTSTAVEVRNPFRRYRIVLTDLVGARTSTNGLQLTTTEGRTVSSWVLQKAPIAQRTRRHTRADDAVREIRRAAERAWRVAGRTPPPTLHDEHDPRKRHPRQRPGHDRPDPPPAVA